MFTSLFGIVQIVFVSFRMFENLPDKIKKLYQEKMREEDAVKQHAGGAANDEGKWKMKFSKDERQGDAKKQTKNFTLYESDDEEQTRNFQGGHQSGFGLAASTSTTTTNFVDKKRSPAKQSEVPAPLIPKDRGPVVLDKFGNFRLAEVPQTMPKPVETSSSSRRSRSRSRRSRSRSDSR
jgi:hypothetical protein